MTPLNQTATLLLLLAAGLSMAAAQDAKTPPPKNPNFPTELVEAGRSRFGQQCGFCHGRDAGGGEDGPDLTRSKLVSDDKNGGQIGAVVKSGRPDKGMPSFDVSAKELSELVAFIKTEKYLMETQKGGRKGVDVADLQTGNAEAGKAYFDGPGKCASCHSPTGDLAGLTKRFEGLKLEQRFLYPKDAKETVTVTLASGQKVTGKLAYQDEFTIGLKDESGRYRSWPTSAVRFAVDAPAEAHAELLTKYSDDDIHNLMAYLQTLK